MNLMSDLQSPCIPSLSGNIYKISLGPVREYGTAWEQVRTKDVWITKGHTPGYKNTWEDHRHQQQMPLYNDGDQTE